MTFTKTDDPIVREAYDRVVALRQLAATTGMKTYKSQSAILESLSPQVLAAVALLLNKKENVNDPRQFNRK